MIMRALVSALLLVPLTAMAVDYAVVADHPDGLYDAGGQVVWTMPRAA